MTNTRLLPAALIALACIGCASRQPAATPAGMVPVPRGRFTMGLDDGELNERPEHRVRLPAYAVDRLEVSAAEFAEFLNAAGNPDERYFTPDDRATVVLLPAPGENGRDRYAARPGLERLPANNVSWYGADAYCRWKGRRLPTEAEWEKAARGPDKRPYPWGKSAPTDANARYRREWDAQGFDALAPVDALPAGSSPYGALNLAGNVQEWVADWYRQNLCDFCNPELDPNLPLIRQLVGCGEDGRPPGAEHECGPAAGARGADEARRRQAPIRENPPGPAVGAFRVLRGGSWLEHDPAEVSATHRFWLAPEQRFAHTGFRCAATPPPEVAPAR